MDIAAIVYGLFDARGATNGEIFYVGMGARKRPFQHLNYANSERGHVNFRMQEILADHLIRGLEPDVVILAECEEYEEAIEIERDLIIALGRKDIDPDGILLNIEPGWTGNKKDWRVPVQIRSAHTSAMNVRLWSDLEHRTTRCLAMRKPKLKTVRGTAARMLNLEGCWTPEAKAKVVEAVIARWADPEYKARLSDAKKEAWKDPKLRSNMLTGRAEGISESWKDPAIREKRVSGLSQAISKRWSDPAIAEANKAGLKAAWQDPKKKAARVKKMLKSRNRKRKEREAAGIVRPKSEGRVAAMKRLNAAKTAAQRSAEQTASWDNPEIRDRRLSGIQRAAQSPELTAARVAAMNKARADKAAIECEGTDTHNSEESPSD